ncbi:MAG: hypothetical protein HY869_08425 [Chloroflexi bacterium]|nr:hypothetical protein [Chloroflexota bacterium]
MSGKKWCYARVTPFLVDPNGIKRFDLSCGALLEPTGQQRNLSINGHDSTWTEVQHTGGDGIVSTGWVNDAYLEDYIEPFPNTEVVIPNPTPELNDAPQYMLVGGKQKFNMCGELCVAFIVGEDIDMLLAKWKAAAPGFYNNILAGDRDKPTGPEDIRSILTAYEYSTDNGQLVSFKAGLTDPLVGFEPTQGRMGRMLETHFLVALVTINSYGRLIRKPDDSSTKRGKNRPVVEKGIGHWVVVDKITPNGRNAGRVELYNPFHNRRQEYSFNEFYKSCSSPAWSGWWVERNLGG